MVCLVLSSYSAKGKALTDRKLKNMVSKRQERKVANGLTNTTKVPKVTA